MNIQARAVQYNHRKAEWGHFTRTGVLAPPPRVLINAALDLEAQRERIRKDPVAENIKRINTNILGLRKYRHPSLEYDYLYLPNYVYLDPKLSCDECGCDLAQHV